jgi:hypothetical protein
VCCRTVVWQPDALQHVFVAMLQQLGQFRAQAAAYVSSSSIRIPFEGRGACTAMCWHPACILCLVKSVKASERPKLPLM